LPAANRGRYFNRWTGCFRPINEQRMSEQSLLEFPCQFPIKVMGKANVDLDMVVVEIVRRHASDIHEGAVTSRSSKGGNYLAVTIVVEASSQRQLDDIYRDLTGHPHILMVL
jgi:putative lipoic acid-binding regulatory protein